MGHLDGSDQRRRERTGAAEFADDAAGHREPVGNPLICGERDDFALVAAQVAVEGRDRERMGQSHERDLDILAKRDAQRQGPVRGKVPDQGVGQWRALVFGRFDGLHRVTGVEGRSPVPPSTGGSSASGSTSGVSSSGLIRPRSMRGGA